MNRQFVRTIALRSAVAVVVTSFAAAHGAVIFSYDPATGQLPTDQGWGAFEIDTTGPLTAPNPATGTSTDNANAAIELVGGANVLHLRDTLTGDANADLPIYYYPWTPAQQQQLVDNGLKFTFVFQTLNAIGGNGLVRFGFNDTLFETQLDNIVADQKIAAEGLQALAPQDGQFHTLVITGTLNGANMDFARSVDGGASVALTPANNNSPAGSVIESTVYFGAFSSNGTQTDILVKSVIMETNVPEPATAGLACAALLVAGMRRRR